MELKAVSMANNSMMQKRVQANYHKLSIASNGVLLLSINPWEVNMEIARFYKKGYTAYTGIRQWLYDEEDGHEKLMDYISCDMTHLPKILEQFVAKKMKLSHPFTLNNDYEYTDDDKNEVIEALKKIHPFYARRGDIVVDAIGSYFNALLFKEDVDPDIYLEDDDYVGQTEDANDYASGDDEETEKEVEENRAIREYKMGSFYDWYKKRLHELTRMFFTPLYHINKQARDFYDEYNRMAIKFTINGYDVPDAIGFAEEIKLQKNVIHMLYCIFDYSMPIVGKLSLPQRAWLYENIFTSGYCHKNITSQKKMMLSSSYSDEANHALSNEYRIIRDETAEWINSELNVDKLKTHGYRTTVNDVPEQVIQSLQKATEYAVNLKDGNEYEEYFINDLFELLFHEMAQMLKNDTGIKRCKLCGMYFAVTDKKFEYCERPNGTNGKLCSETGRSYKTKLQKDKPLEIYNRAYKKYHARKSKGNMDENEWLSWSKNARDYLDDFRSGKLEVNIDTFEKMINTIT